MSSSDEPTNAAASANAPRRGEAELPTSVGDPKSAGDRVAGEGEVPAASGVAAEGEVPAASGVAGEGEVPEASGEGEVPAESESAGSPRMSVWKGSLHFAIFGGAGMDSSSRPPRNEIRYTVGGAVCIAAAIAVAGWADEWVVAGLVLFAVVAFVLSAVGALSAVAYDRNRDTQQGSSVQPGHGGGGLHPVSALALTAAITDPHRYYVRIKQSVRQLSLAFEVETQYTIALGSIAEHLESEPSRAGSLYLPVVLARKGVLHDDFQIRWRGQEVPTATFEESLGVIRNAIQTLAIDILDEESLVKYEALEDRLMEVVALRRTSLPRGNGYSSAVTRERLRQADEVIEEVATLFGKDKYIAIRIAQIVTVLATNYYIFAVIPLEDLADEPWFVVETKERQILDHRTMTREGTVTQEGVASMARVLSRTYGLRPDRIEYSTSLAQLCSSYHIQIMGSEGTYLWRQRVEMPESHQFRYRRFRSRRGQRYLHLYLRGVEPKQDDASIDDKVQREIGGDAVDVVAQFKERLPGAFPGAVIAASVSAIVLLLAGEMNNPRDVTVFGLLLAAPGAMVAYSSFAAAAASNRMGASLAPHISRTMTMIVTLAGLGLYIRGVVAPGAPLTVELPLGTTLELWPALARVALLNVIITLVLWAKAAIVHFSFIDYRTSEFLRKGAIAAQRKDG